LFDASIAENIAYGSPGASRQDIEEAARQANAYDFITAFPEGFDTPVSGGSGTQLSGGQKVRYFPGTEWKCGKHYIPAFTTFLFAATNCYCPSYCEET
jgi:hypothetical protein